MVRMGGAEYQAHLLAEELSRRPGVEVIYLARVVPPGAMAESLPYSVQGFGSLSGIRQRGAFFSAMALWSALEELKPNAIYQRMKQGHTAVCAQYAMRHRIPLIFHAANAPDVSGEWLRKRVSANLPIDLVDVWFGNWGIKRATVTIVQTEAQRSLFSKRFGRDASAIVRNFQPLPSSLPDKLRGGLRVLWVANFKDAKRPEAFVQLANNFRARRDMEFWMVGRPSTHRRFRRLMTEIQNSVNLRYFGELPQNEVNRLMAEADVFVNTSLFEGSPNTFIQAWSRGAIVTSLSVDVDGGLERQGIGYCAGDLERLRHVLEELNASPQLRTEIAVRAFAHVQRVHSLKNVVELADLVLSAGNDGCTTPQTR
jgi:glycosyltransferase involved in cell wall biosynthesis